MFKSNLLDVKVNRSEDNFKMALQPQPNSNSLDLQVRPSFQPWVKLPALIQAGMVLIFGVLLFRLAVIQIYTAPIWQEWSSRSTQQIVMVDAPRGRILDRRGQLIVGNQPSFTLVTSYNNLQQTGRQREIMTAFGLTEENMKRSLKLGSSGSIKLKDNLNKKEILGLIGRTEELGVDIIPEYHRFYVNDQIQGSTRSFYGQSVSSFVGYTGLPTEQDLKTLDREMYQPDTKIGVSGLEQVYESVLQGKSGKIERQIGKRNQVEDGKTTQQMQVGQDLTTTIDLKLQLKLSQVMQEEFGKNNLKAGSLVMMNTDTGAIRSMVNFPNFDPESFEDRGKQSMLAGYYTDEQRPLFNRATRGQYPPGSSIKPFVGAVGLENKLITPAQEIYDPGSIRVESKQVAGRVDEYINYKRSFFGNINLAKAIAKSSDVFFYYLAGGDPESGKIPTLNNSNQSPALGIDKLQKGLEQHFGLGQPTGIDLESENKGIIPNPEYKAKLGFGNWFLGDSYQTAIGQGFMLVTPLQMTRAVAVIANGGFEIKPHLRQDVTLQKGKTLLSPETTTFIDKAMRGVVTEGTAKRLQDNQSAVAAKTGSAQFDPKNPDRVYGWVISYNQDLKAIDEKLALVLITEDIDQTAEYVTVPIASRLWQITEQVYAESRSQ